MNESSESSSSDSDCSDAQSDIDESEIKEKIGECQKRVDLEPSVFDHHVELLAALKVAGELEQLREARNTMNKMFSLTPNLWLEWIEDEKKLVSSEAERDGLVELFERALKEFNCPDVWLEYVQFSIGDMDRKGPGYVREVFEKALSAVGLHVTKAPLLWQAYLEFEGAILAGLQPNPESNVTEEQSDVHDGQVKKILTIFKRQLSIPLRGMESTFQKYKSFVEDIDSNIAANYKKAKLKWDTLMPFEDALQSGDPSKVDAYKAYINHELKEGDPARIQSIFERAVIENSLIPDFWLRYGKYLDQELRSRSAILNMYERAVKNCSWSADLWLLHLRAMERFRYSEHELIKSEFNKILNGNYLQEASDYLKIWQGYCDYLRRRITWDTQEGVEDLRVTFKEAVESLSEYYGKDGDPNCSLLQYQARLEAKFCKNMEKARECWNTIMQQGFGNQAQMWLEYFYLERSFGDHKHCRKILQRALNSVTDWPDYIVEAYVNFEREEGTLEQYEQAIEKCDLQMARLNERKAKAAEKEASVDEMKKKRQQTAQPYKGKGKQQLKQQTLDKKQKPREVVSKNLDVKTETNGVMNQGDSKPPNVPSVSSGFKVPVAPPPGYKGASGDQAPSPQGSQKLTEEPPSKKMKVDEPTLPVTETKGGNTIKCKVFVSNLDFNLKESDLTPIFMKYGELKDIRLVKGFQGKSRGFGYVEFKEEGSAKAALALDRSLVKGRPMYVSECKENKEAKSSSFKYATDMEKTKLFIKNIPLTTTKECLEKIFSEHGKLKEVRMVTYRNGAFKGLAYVEYTDEESASKAVLKTDGLKIENQQIFVAISNPPQRKAQAKEVKEEVKFTPTLGGGKKEADRGGRARTMLSFTPRSLKQSKPVVKKAEPSSTVVAMDTSDSKPT